MNRLRKALSVKVSSLVTTNLPFDEWTDVSGSERLTGALLDRLTHHVHILEMNGDSYRLKGSRQDATASSAPATVPVATPTPKSESSAIISVVHFLSATVVEVQHKCPG